MGTDQSAPSTALPAFPTDFLWGVATASYQIEGAVDEDGRTPSIWDTFCRVPGAVANGDTGDVACDHYHRHTADVALLQDLGVGAYRFSIAWPRVIPGGRGAVNQKGLDFYRELTDELLAAGITPVATLYHWDLPQVLEDEGGWRVRSTAQAFSDYAAVVHEALADRIGMWITLNEPFCSAFLGYADGRHAPGAREGHGALAAAHHLLLGHGWAIQAMRAQGQGPGPFQRLGITLNLNDVRPAPQTSSGDAPGTAGSTGQTAQEDMAGAVRRARCLSNEVFTDPILSGSYPAAEQDTWGAGAEAISDFSFRMDGDLDVISTPIDFLGVNTYFPEFIAPEPHTEPDPKKRTAMDVGTRSIVPDDLPRTEMGWPVDPAIMTGLMAWLRTTYPALPPIYITENGAAFPDVAGPDGRVHDSDRISYLDGHLRALGQAIADGSDVRGYFCWSLMDNFEWAYGYEKRFGLVHVDYPTQTRTPKDSYDWYRRLIEANAG